jgi:hypothetical protein
MRVTEVQATVKYSTEVSNGSWLAIELSGTAALTNSEETLESATTELYNRLTQQIKTLYREKKSEGGDSRKQETQPKSEHHCPVHNTQFKRFAKGNQVWFSHRTGNGWCREQ